MLNISSIQQKSIHLFSSDQNIFLLSNIIFSASTYFVMLFIPYLLTMQTMAEFSSSYNALMLLLFVFEFGISMSFLRFFQLYKITFLINAMLQMIILIGLFLMLFSPFGKMIINFFHLGQYGLNIPLFFIALISQLGWIFSKNILLAESKYRYLLGISLSILAFRITLLCYLYTLHTLTINSILLTMFIIPFIAVFFTLLLSNYKTAISFEIKLNNPRIRKIFFKYVKRFIKFSLMTYIIGILYIFSSRYLIIYLTEKNQFSLLADLGYAMTFLGIMTIASTSFRTFFIAKFHLGDTIAINNHLDKYFSKIKFFSLLAVLIATLLSIIVYGIMPSYLSFHAPVFVFIMISSYGIIFLLSLITFLSRTMNYNMLEMTINIIRLILIILITHFLLINSPVVGFLLINLVLLTAEIIFAKIILKRLSHVH